MEFAINRTRVDSQIDVLLESFFFRLTLYQEFKFLRRKLDPIHPAFLLHGGILNDDDAMVNNNFLFRFVLKLCSMERISLVVMTMID